MASEDVELRLSLSQRRETAAGLAQVEGNLDDVAAAGRAVGEAGRDAAAGLERASSSRIVGALAATRRGVLGLAGALGRGVVSAARGAAVAVAATTVAVGALSVKSIGLAGDARETASAFDTVFGPSARGVATDLAKLTNEFGIYGPQLKDAARQLGVFGKAAGVARKDLPAFSTDLVKAGLDLSSFYNVSSGEAFQAIQSGLAGEAEPLRRFGIFISDAAMKAEAATLGLTEELTEQQKVMIRQRLIMKGLGDAQGDLARTADGFANQQRAASGRAQTLLKILGGPLTTAATGAFRGMNMVLQAVIREVRREFPQLEKGAGSLSDTFERWGRVLSGKIPGSIDRIVAGARDLRGTIRTASDAIGGFFGQVNTSGASGEQFSALAANIGEIGRLAGMVADSGIDATLTVLNTVMGFFADHADTIAGLMPVLVAGFIAFKVAQMAANVATVLAVPASVNLATSNRALAAATRQLTAAQGQQTAAQQRATTTTTRRTVVTTASTTSTTANTTATGANTAAQTTNTTTATRRTAVITTTTTVTGANTVATGANTTATGANTAATNAGTLARVRSRIAAIAWGVVAKAQALWTGIVTAAQWALNVAMSANPIGLVVLAIGALIAGFVLLYKRSDTFRGLVDGLWNNVLKPFGKFIGEVFVGYLKLMAKMWLSVGIFAVQALKVMVTAAFSAFDAVLSAAEKGLGWVPGLGDKIKDARAAFNEFGDSVITKLEGVEAKLVSARQKVDDLGKDREATITIRTVYVGSGGELTDGRPQAGSAPAPTSDADTGGGAEGGRKAGRRRPRMITPTGVGVPERITAVEDPKGRGWADEVAAASSRPVVVPVYLKDRQIAEAVHDDSRRRAARG